MTNIDAMAAIEKFFKKYPNGEITKEQFMEVMPQFISCLSFTFNVRKTKRTL